MNEATIKERLAELNDVMNATHLRAGKAAAEGVYVSEAQRNMPIEEILNNLRLQLRYLLFDLEATRRENRYLRQMLESRHRPPREDEPKDEPPVL
ncbi:MAG: hypothetical protein ACE15C_02295 [Phycisphaerae bacterium]